MAQGHIEFLTPGSCYHCRDTISSQASDTGAIRESPIPMVLMSTLYNSRRVSVQVDTQKDTIHRYNPEPILSVVRYSTPLAQLSCHLS